MEDFSAELIIAVGGAALLAALAFRQMIGTLIKLNDELQEAVADRRYAETQRTTLQNRVNDLETQLKVMTERLEAQTREIQLLQQNLEDCKQLIRTSMDEALSPEQS